MEELPPMPLLSLSTPAVIEHCANLKDCADGRKTLFIASFPKSGTTWMQAIIYNLLTNGDQNFKHISEYSPFFEIIHIWDLESGSRDGKLKAHYEANNQRLGRRVFNTHLRWEMMPKEPNMRYIYVVRNGKDVALSFFQHLSNQDDADCFNGNLADFVKQWSNGETPFGNWIHHLQSWMRAYQAQGSHGPILLLRYQDLVSDPLACILRIVNHLGLSTSEERTQELLQYVSFSYMKAHQEQYMPISVPWKEGYSFLRKGQVGDSENYFTEEHNAVYDAMIQRMFAEQGGVPAWLRELEVL
jgi:hypothetical protein